MYFAHEIPELTVYPRGFPGYWLGAVFAGTFDWESGGKSLVTAYVRFVEAAYRRYREGREGALTFIDSDGSAVPIGAYMYACTSFEDCVSHMHRAIQCITGIRKNRIIPEQLRALLADRPNFLLNRTPDRIRELRNTIQHNYQALFDGQIAPGSPTSLMVEGHEEPVLGQPGQILKTWDRIQIGQQSILLRDLHAWLVAMGDCADAISRYRTS